MSIFGRLFGSSPGNARSEAIATGVSVEDIERDLPIFDRGNRFERLQRGSCVRYSLPRRAGSLPRTWAFLQRDETLDAPFPHGWTFQSPDRELPESLHAELKRVAAEWTEEYLEFDAVEDKVSAYWEEWGGAREASVVIGYLQGLAHA